MKQETLEQFMATLPYYGHCNYEYLEGIEEGAKWQQERSYSEADKIMKFLDTEIKLGLSDIKTIERVKWYLETYFEQFKKK
jgi:hypothetical protein